MRIKLLDRSVPIREGLLYTHSHVVTSYVAEMINPNFGI